MKKCFMKALTLVTALVMMLTLLPVNVMAEESTVTVAVDKTNYTGTSLKVEAYDLEGSRVARLRGEYENFATISFTKDCYVHVSSQEEFTVTVDGATVGPLQEGETYYYEITNFTKDTTIVINGDTTDEPSTDNVVSELSIQLDWNKVPLLEKGMTIENFIPEEDGGIGDACFEESPASVSGAVKEIDVYGWAIEVDNSFYIGDEEAVEIYDRLGNTDEVREAIVDYNDMITEGIEDYNGWLPLEIFLSKASILDYEINEEDTYAVWLGVETEDGKVFAEPNADGEFSGEIDSNVEVGSSIYSGGNLVVFFKLGTLAEMEEEKNVGSYPVDGVVPSLGDDSIKVEDNTVKFNVPANDEDYFYVKVVFSETHLKDTGMSVEAYRDMINGGVGKDVLDVKDLGDTLEELAEYSASGQIYGLSSPDINFTDDAPITEKSVAFVVKLHRDNVKNALGQYIYAVYGAHAEVVTPTGSGTSQPPVDTEEGSLDVDTKVDAEAPIQDITLGNNENELLEDSDIFTDEEKEAIANGEDSKVWLEVDKVDEDALDEDDKVKFENAAKEAAGSATNIVYFEADLFKQVGSANPEKVAEPGVEIEITFTIPSELLNKDKNVERTYKILRLHDDKVEIIEGKFNAETGEFTFKTDKFSTYGIVWTDKEKAPDTNTTPNVSGNEGTKSPNTGDSSMMTLPMVVVALGVVLFVNRKKLVKM